MDSAPKMKLLKFDLREIILRAMASALYFKFISSRLDTLDLDVNGKITRKCLRFIYIHICMYMGLKMAN